MSGKTAKRNRRLELEILEHRIAAELPDGGAEWLAFVRTKPVPVRRLMVTILPSSRVMIDEEAFFVVAYDDDGEHVVVRPRAVFQTYEEEGPHPEDKRINVKQMVRHR